MAKIIVKKKVIVEEIVIPEEYTESLQVILSEYEKIVSTYGVATSDQMNCIAFARQLLRKMRGEEA